MALVPCLRQGEMDGFRPPSHDRRLREPVTGRADVDLAHTVCLDFHGIVAPLARDPMHGHRRGSKHAVKHRGEEAARH